MAIPTIKPAPPESEDAAEKTSASSSPGEHDSYEEMARLMQEQPVSVAEPDVFDAWLRHSLPRKSTT